MTETYDLLVIGAGMAGIAAAKKCASQGWRVGIVDARPYGGTCALRGCDPKKILRRGAEIIESARLLRGKGIDDNALAINWPDLMEHKRGFTGPIPARMEADLAHAGVETLHGHARFTGTRQVEIDGAPYEAHRFLIATGARPRTLSFPGHEHLIDSTEFLDLEALPARVLFVGGGFISFEFAHLVARAGSTATIIDRGPRPLKEFDPDLVERLIDRSSDVGITLMRDSHVTSVEKRGQSYQVTVEHKGVTETVDADLVVHGAGRVADIAALNLEAAEVQWDAQGVHVHGHLQSTTNPAVWAAGDAAGTVGAPLTPVAVSEAKVAASNMIKGTTKVPDYVGIPTAVFTIPELVRVGLLEDEARKQGIDLDIRYTDTGDWYSNYRVGESTAAAKVLIDRSRDLIVGAHLLGPDYGELINTFALAIKLGLTTRQLKSATTAYPTTGSDLASLL